MQHFFRSLLPNLIACFSGRNLVWHGVAILGTFVIVMSGFDWWYFVTAQSLPIQFLFSSAVIGGLVPMFLPLGLIVWGFIRKNKTREIIGWALLQATILGSLISSTYKAFTGRIQPNLANTLIDSSHGFQIGFWEHGIFWGWPSSHTTIAFAMVMAFVTLFPGSRKVRVLAPAYAFYIGIGISTNIHWFSEFFAGAIIGTVIGVVVGKSFSPHLVSSDKNTTYVKA
jgi:membrane-associated phospholipid phosphatase